MICKKCLVDKAIEEFYLLKRKEKEYRDLSCRKCMNKYRADQLRTNYKEDKNDKIRTEYKHTRITLSNRILEIDNKITNEDKKQLIDEGYYFIFK